jgi:hypothetical protein
MLPEFNTPWHPVEVERCVALERELELEVNSAHVLHGRKARALAMRQDCDDVLFELDGGKAGYATVHLTWIMKKESTPEYPSTEVHASLEDWVAQRMIPDCNDWNS